MTVGAVLATEDGTVVTDAARATLRGDIASAPLIHHRNCGPWPNQAELLALPTESLGHTDASWFADAGGQPLPDPVLQTGSDGDDI